MFLFYQILVFLIIFFSPIILLFRIFKKKEDKIRFVEKFSIFSKKRMNGNLVWFHGSSVGEILSVIPLIENLEKNKSIKQILVTSSTLSSSIVFKKFKFKKVMHQFFPIDVFFLTNKFLNYWKPTIAIFIESEIWPCMFIGIKKRRIPLVLINARITKKTFDKWFRFKNFTYGIFNKISFAYPQNFETLKYLKKLKVSNIKLIGNLKYSENRNNDTKILDKKILNEFRSRKIWCASSTHLGEELICAKSHIKLKKKFKNLLTIIIPRHVQRSDEIKKKLEELNLRVLLRSSNKKKLKEIDIYLVDTYGETKKFYKNTNTVFLGGSFIKHGGQNPIEPARLGANIIHGPHVNNFKEVYKLLNSKKISYQANNGSQLTNILEKTIKDLSNNKSKFLKIKNVGKSILKITTNEINNLIRNEIKKT